MMQRLLFEHGEAILTDLRCNQGKTVSETLVPIELPYFGGITIVFAGDYSQLLPVVPSRRPEERADGSLKMVPVSLLNELPWCSILWKDIKVLRLTQQV